MIIGRFSESGIDPVDLVEAAFGLLARGDVVGPARVELLRALHDRMATPEFLDRPGDSGELEEI